MILLIIVMHLIFAWILFTFNLHRVMFLGPSFSFSIVYVWSRKAQHVQMNFLGLFAFQAPYLPLVILAFGTVLGQSPIPDLLGLLAGHVYWFFEDVYPQIRPGRHWTAPPRLLKLLFDAPEPPAAAAANEAEREEPPIAPRQEPVAQADN